LTHLFLVRLMSRMFLIGQMSSMGQIIF